MVAKTSIREHRRDQYFAGANLGNVLAAASGLLVFLVYWHRPELWALKITPALEIFDIEGIGRVGGFIPDYHLKDFGNRGTKGFAPTVCFITNRCEVMFWARFLARDVQSISSTPPTRRSKANPQARHAARSWRCSVLAAW